MQSFTPGALVRYGFGDRVLALLTSAADPDHPDLEPARIVRVERSACVAVGPDGAERPLLADPLPAVGDWVLADATAVRHVASRWSALSRADPVGRGVQVLAADIDLVLVVTPADRSSVGRVERELALAAGSGAVPHVVLTKSDLDPGGSVAAGLRARLSGIELTAVSAVRGDGVAELAARLAPDRTAVLIGPSGAGKSTLANALLHSDRLATGAVREGDRRGRHTTTSRQLVALPGGGTLIDTPGLRSLGLTGEVDLGAGFPDVEALAAGCRFADCEHDREPGCAVLAAIAEGALDPDRLRSFRKLAAELAAPERRTGRRGR